MWSGGRELESWAGAGPRSLGVSPAPHHRLRRLIPCSLPIGTSSARKDLESRPQSAVWAPTPHLFLLGKPRRATGFPTLAKTSKPQVRSPHRLQGAAGTWGPSYQGRGSRRFRGLRGPHALASARDQRRAVSLPPNQVRILTGEDSLHRWLQCTCPTRLSLRLREHKSGSSSGTPGAL